MGQKNSRKERQSFIAASRGSNKKEKESSKGGKEAEGARKNVKNLRTRKGSREAGSGKNELKSRRIQSRVKDKILCPEADLLVRKA